MAAFISALAWLLQVSVVGLPAACKRYSWWELNPALSNIKGECFQPTAP